MVASFYHSLVLSQKVVFVNLIPKYVRWVSESVLTVRHHTDHQWVILKQYVPHRVAGKHTSQLLKKTKQKNPHTQSGISVHVCVFIGKTKCKDEHVHLGMQINWTKQNSWTGPGLAAPIHTPTHARTHTHAQTEDRNTAKHRPPSPLKWTCVHTQHLRQWHFILSSLPVNLKPFVYSMLRQKLLVYVDHL